jgi:processive 1,2-diacylglycerol beta-glucosyltransferase
MDGRILRRFMPRLLILTAGYGEGHNAAARGLLAAAQHLGVDAEIADPFVAMGSTVRSVQTRLPIPDQSRAAHLGGDVPADRPAADRRFTLPLLATVKEELSRVLQEKQPEVVISVYPAYSFLVARLFPTRRPFAFHTVVTDSITINRVWHQAPSDSWIVPNERTAKVMKEQGVPEATRANLGLPRQSSVRSTPHPYVPPLPPPAVSCL